MRGEESTSNWPTPSRTGGRSWTSAPWRGKTVTLQVDKLPEDSTALSSIEQSDEIKGAENLYREPLRAQFHFSPRRGWNNDPNGLVFYQRRISPVLPAQSLRLELGQHALGPRRQPRSGPLAGTGRRARARMSMGPMFSGSAVVDWNNTSGFGKPGRPAQVLDLHRRREPHRAVHRLQHRWPHLHEVQRQPGGEADHRRQPRSESASGTSRRSKWVMALYVELNESPHDPFPQLAEPEGLDGA